MPSPASPGPATERDWRERILRPASIVAASRFVGEVMAVLPVAFGAMAAYVPKPDSKAAGSNKRKAKAACEPEAAEAASARKRPSSRPAAPPT